MENSTVITIAGADYLFLKNYKDNAGYRASLNKLTRETYGFDFEEWYQLGYWGDGYRPYSLVHQEEVVANVSVNPIIFKEAQNTYETLQIGTVMTKKEYRNRGLCRVLLQHILEEYKDCCDMIYLYANDTVLNFYPKFGFRRAEEYDYFRVIRQEERLLLLCRQKEQKLQFARLNGANEKDRKLIYDIVSSAAVSSRYRMMGNPGLTMFYLTSFLADHLYYCEKQELLVVAEYEEDKLKLVELFCKREIDLDVVISALIKEAVTEVSLGFTPIDTRGFQCRLRKEEGTTLFLIGKNFMQQGRLPELSHA